MTRCVQYLYRAATQVKNLTVDRFMNRKICLCMRTIDDGCTRNLGQVQMTAYKIRVKMRFKNVLDGCLSLLRKIQVYIHITQRIDDSRFAITFDIIRCLTQASSI